MGKPKIFKIPLDKAIAWGLLPTPEIIVVDYYLDGTNPYLYYTLGKDKKKETIEITYTQWISNYKYAKGTKPNLKIKCTEAEYMRMIDYEFEKLDWILKANNYRGVNWVYDRKKRLGLNRKNFFALVKIPLIKKILSNLKNERTIIFTNTKEQADDLASYLKIKAVHSGYSTNDNQITIDNFNNKITNKIVAVKQLDESVNLIDPDVAIIIQLSGSDSTNISVQNVQRMGRGIRSKNPTVYIIRIPNTRDHDFFNDFYESLDPLWFKFINYKNI